MRASVRPTVRILTAALLWSSIIGTASALEKVTVILDYPYPVGEHAGFQLAAVKGWHEAAGYDVDIQMGKGSSTTIQQIAAGQGDIGIAQLSAVATTISAGLPVMSVMGLVQVGDLAMTVGQDTGFKTVGDVRGKKIAAPAAGAATTLLGSFFNAINIPQSEVNVVYVDSTSLLAAFTAKSVDGIVAGASFTLPRSMHLRPSNTVYFSDFGLNLPGYGLVVKKDSITNKAEMLRKILAVQQRAWAYIQQGNEREAVDALVQRGARFRPDPQLLSAELKLLLARFETPGNKGKPVGYQAESDWKDSLVVLEKAKLVKPGSKPTDYFDNRFLEGN